MKTAIQIVRLFLASTVLFSLGITPALSSELLSQEETYRIPLSYYCVPSEVKYGGIDFVGVVVSNKNGFFQEFASEGWKVGHELPLKDYQTETQECLIITKRMLPLEFSVMPIWSRQLPKIHKAIMDNVSDKTSPKPTLAGLQKAWQEEGTQVIFDIEENDLFDEKGKFNASKILIKCSNPFSMKTYYMGFY